MERQLQTAQDHPDPPKGLVCLRLRPAQQDGIIGIPNQLTQMAAAILPYPIQLVKDHIRQHARNHTALGYALLAGKELPTVQRSEEHTSELQSHHDLVCRLL